MDTAIDNPWKTARQDYRTQLDILHDIMMSHAQIVLGTTSGNIDLAAPLLFDRLAADDRYQRAYAELESLESNLNALL